MYLLTLLVCVTGAAAAATTDTNQVVSVTYNDSQYRVLPGYQHFDTVVVWASFGNDQRDTGWLHLDISSSASFPDHVQAVAAGYAEGYLTSRTIYKYYQEFFTTDLCKNVKGFCSWMRGRLEVNQAWIDQMVKVHADTDPYWHMVNMFYSQVRHQTK